MFKQRLFLVLTISLLLLAACSAQNTPAPEQGTQKQGQQNPAADQLEREEQPAPEQPEEPKDAPEEKIYFFPNSVLKDYYGTWRITRLAVGAKGCYETDQGSSVIGQTVTVSEDNIAFLDYTFKISSIGHDPVEWYLEKSNFLIADSYWLCGGEIIFDEEKGEVQGYKTRCMLQRI